MIAMSDSLTLPRELYKQPELYLQYEFVVRTWFRLSIQVSVKRRDVRVLKMEIARNNPISFNLPSLENVLIKYVETNTQL